MIMLKVVTAEEMQEIDRVTIEEYGIAGTILMERAGLSVARVVDGLLKEGRERTVIVLCGGGNNGGDGMVVARLLHNQGYNVVAFLTAEPDELKGDARINYNAAKRFGVRVYPIDRFLTHYSSHITHHTIIIDALLGTGLNKEVRGTLKTVIEKVNKSSSTVTSPPATVTSPPATVVSIDIPSGISSDNGQIMGCAIKANYTVTFGLPKRGHLIFPGAEHTGRLFIEDIGFPQGLLKSRDIRVNLVERDDVALLLPERPRYSHKGRYGHVLLIAGSKGKTGAGLMSARACLRTGAGLVTIGVPESLMNIFQSRVTEEMTLPLPDNGKGSLSISAYEKILGFMKRVNVLAIGPGLSVDEEIREVVKLLITKSNIPIVIDADGINAIAGDTGILKEAKSPIILTPHPGEMMRLLGEDSGYKIQDIERERIDIAVSFSNKTKTYLILKGVPTVIATPQGDAFINPTGNPGMAKAGTGDVLTGMVSALLAQGLSPRDACIVGVYLHGLSGDMASEKKGVYSVTASDIIRMIPSGFKGILERQ
ncbi:MAG: NAD(P)H-hydrate dehydratase [Thermodesulfovibrionia bacterium]